VGARVKEAGEQPDQWRKTACGECGHERIMINGAWLKWRRQRAGIDQRTFAKRLGISGPYLSDLERNRRDCPDSIEIAYRRLRR